MLGDGTTGHRIRPTPVAADTPFKAVSSGGSHTCALTTDGTAYCWGENYAGELGAGDWGASRSSPARVATDLTFSSIAVGGAHTCAIDDAGKVYCWGLNEHRQLGAVVTGSCWTPCATVPVEVDTELRFEAISLGGRFTCGLTQDSEIFCWGSNVRGQLGTTTQELCELSSGDTEPCSSTPVPISGGGVWEEVSTFSQHVCALAIEGTVHCWGWGRNGELGDGIALDDPGFRAHPAPVAGDLRFVGVSAGPSHSCAISAEGPTYCWGSGVLGDGTSEQSLVPVEVATPVRFGLVTVGGSHACGLAEGGVLYCWGSNQYGQLGDASYALGWATPVAVRGW